jgi:hypothetical protein
MRRVACVCYHPEWKKALSRERGERVKREPKIRKTEKVNFQRKRKVLKKKEILYESSHFYARARTQAA